MNRYMHYNNIFGPILLFILYLIIQVTMISMSWFNTDTYRLVSVLVALYLSISNLPTTTDLDFVGSFNVSLSRYLISMVKRNLWFNGVCLMASVMMMSLRFGVMPLIELLVFAILMIAAAVVSVGYRIKNYYVIILFSLSIGLSLLFVNSPFLLLVSFVSIGLSIEGYQKTLRERDLV